MSEETTRQAEMPRSARLGSLAALQEMALRGAHRRFRAKSAMPARWITHAALILGAVVGGGTEFHERRALAPFHSSEPEAMCKPNKVELKCHPTSGLVLSDGSPVERHYRACTRRTCHTDSLQLQNGYTTPSGLVYVGWSVNVRCNAGYVLTAEDGGSATPSCKEDCGFEKAHSCQAVKCTAGSIDPNGNIFRNGQQKLLPQDLIAFDEYATVTCNHGYMASDSAHAHGEACKVSYIRECQADGTLTNRCVPGPGADARRASLTVLCRMPGWSRQWLGAGAEETSLCGAAGRLTDRLLAWQGDEMRATNVPAAPGADRCPGR
jgi:hypothetical protein